MSYSVSFPGGTVQYFFEKRIESLPEIANGRRIIVVTDSNVHSSYKPLFEGIETIVLPSGEAYKNIESVNYITEKLIQWKADRKTLLVGIGGGMVTDITGFVASIYMRGISCGFVPTTLLAMVDASIGGKNGVNFGLYKNMLGTIRQPEFILFDTSFLQTLPDEEWSNGFAEVVKYGCIFDSFLFEALLEQEVANYRNSETALAEIIEKCVSLKNKTVQEDEKEKGVRKLLNFGHTVGHAIEKQLDLRHGYAISIGMLIACHVSEKVAGLNPQTKGALSKLLARYHLPTYLSFDLHETMRILYLDKKRNQGEIDFVVLEKLGNAQIATIPFELIEETLTKYLYAGNH
jgi:3-dehydroquinate synthase